MNLTDIKQRLSARNIELVHVVACDQNRCIGKDNALAWHIPEDLKHFKILTAGGVVIMGRKTFESIGRPLPNRVNWVITRDTAWCADGVKVAHSVEQALELASVDVKNSDKNQLFIIGGGEIYRQTLDIADRLEITHVNIAIEGDAFYPPVGGAFEQVGHSESKTDAQTGVVFSFATYRRLYQAH